MAGRANLKAGRANLRPTGGGDGRTDGRTYGNSPLCSTGHRPFGAAAQKGEEEKKGRMVKVERIN